jgi:hypothetical protein
MNDPATDTLAAELYRAYCTATGGVAFNGAPLPPWEEFAADESKRVQADAWRAVAQRAMALLPSPPGGAPPPPPVHLPSGPWQQHGVQV